MSLILLWKSHIRLLILFSFAECAYWKERTKKMTFVMQQNEAGQVETLIQNFIKQIRWATSPFIHTSIVPSFHYFSIMLAIQLIYRSCWPWPAHFSFNQLEWLEGSDQELGYDEIFSWWGAITWCRDHSHAATPFFNSSSSVVSSPPLHMPGCFNLRSCCSSSGGRLRCPQSYPVMCQNQDTKIWRDDSEQTRLHY